MLQIITHNDAFRIIRNETKIDMVQKSQAFLTRFGYLDRGHVTTTKEDKVAVHESHLTEGLQKFQKYAGLELTGKRLKCWPFRKHTCGSKFPHTSNNKWHHTAAGKIDQKSMDYMRKPRCGFTDSDDYILWREYGSNYEYIIYV